MDLQDGREGSVLIENANQVDGLHRGDDFRTFVLAEDRPIVTLQTPYRCIAVQRHDKDIAFPTGAVEQVDVTRMENVEAAVGKHYPLPGRMALVRQSSDFIDAFDFLSGHRRCVGSGTGHYYSIAYVKVRLGIVVVCVAAFGIGFWTFQAARPEQSRGTFATDPPTPYVHFLPEGPSLGTVLVLHGIDASKEYMKTAAMAMADGGFDVYAIDQPGHGDSPAGISFDDSVRVVEQLMSAFGPATTVVGHSMGGAVLIEASGTNDFETMVLYSPAPVGLEQLRPKRMLVVSGGSFEAPRVADFIPRLLDASGPRAFWWKYPHGTHSTALFRMESLRAVVGWMGGRADALRTDRRRDGLFLMLVAGSILPFAFPLERLPEAPARRMEPPAARDVIVKYIAALSVAVVALRFVAPLEWLGLFATDYMMSVVLISGLLLWKGRSFALSARGLAIGSVAAVYTIVVFGLSIGNHFVDLTPNGTGWLRMPVLAAVGFPLFLYDEETLRRMSSRWKRWGTFIVTRALMWAGVVTGVLLLNRDDGLLVILMHLVLVFWLLLWWMTGFVARKTGEPAAAALFAALVQGWVFASIFIRTNAS